MKYSYSWLKELSGTRKTPEKVVEDLTFHSFEVESLEKMKGDTVIDIKVLPDRAHDAMSHVGVAREMTVLENKKFDYDYDGLKLPRIKTDKVRIEIKDKKLCPRYLGAVMSGITIKDSPDWMKKRLEVSGIRAINNVVDATNYVMLELGQPLHAFDFNKIKSKFPISNIQYPKETQNANIQIVIRRAKDREKIELLDGVVKELTSDDLLITDGNNPLAIAGIKGGKMAEIDENTKAVVLESANFNGVKIRRTRNRLGLRTDSSDRFEKDIDPNLAEKAMVRLIEIIEHTAGGKIEGVSDIYPNPIKPWKIKLDLDYVNNLLGENVPAKEVVKIFKALGIKTKVGKVLECIIPTYRIDLITQEDLIEEIGRIWGYEKIEEQPIISEILPAQINKRVFFERKIQDILSGMGFSEVYNYSFYSQEDIDICGLEKIKHLELENPMNPEQQFVRANLFPNIFKNIKENSKHFGDFMIFETGKCYDVDGKGKVEEGKILSLALILEKEKKGELFFKAKGILEDMADSLGIDDITFEKPDESLRLWDLKKCALIKSKNKIIGKFGEANQKVLDSYKLKNVVVLAEIDIEALMEQSSRTKIYEPINKFPIVVRDISMLSNSNVAVSEIIGQIKKIGGSLLLNVELFDIFKKDNKNSFAFHVEFGSKSRTLESIEVDEAMKEIIAKLEEKFKIEIRK
jgi:phenylalanyl-tRNA synthetase beta chain